MTRSATKAAAMALGDDLMLQPKNSIWSATY